MTLKVIDVEDKRQLRIVDSSFPRKWVQMLENVRKELFLGGHWVVPATGNAIPIVSPFDETVIGEVPLASTLEVDRAVDAARAAFDSGVWRSVAPKDRGEVMGRGLAELEPRADELAELCTREIACRINHSRRGHVSAALAILRDYAELAAGFDFEEWRTDGPRRSVVLHEPTGVVAAIVPWNGPLLITMLKLAPAIAAGCSVVLKPALEAPLEAFILAEVFERAGLPPGVLSIVPTDNAGAEHLVRHNDVDAVTFTGSSAVGAHIGSLCGEHLRRVTLELGGKSAAIILEDADLDKTINPVLEASFLNNGQACINQSRILVPARRRDEMVEAIVDRVSAISLGNPMDPDVEIGPLINEKQRNRVESYIKIGQEEGARIVVGGRRPDLMDTGFFVEPTVFVDVKNSMRISQEEIFGPVVCVIEYDSVDDAVRIANDSKYGLSGSVWTEDVDAGLNVARRVRTGTYRVNGADNVFGVPVGGFKHSGIGREFGIAGLCQYLETKSVAVPTDWAD